MYRYLVLGSFIILGIAFMVIFIDHRRRGHEFIGNPPVSKLLFILGKIGVFGSWFIMLLKAIIPRTGYIIVPDALMWVAAAILMLAVILFVISFFQLGTALKMGLPNEKTELRTTGLYRLSRNPIYLAMYMILIASVMYFPDPLNLALAIMAAVIHHRTTLAEEKFLLARFGSAWTDYTSRTRRYL